MKYMYIYYCAYNVALRYNKEIQIVRCERFPQVNVRLENSKDLRCFQKTFGDKKKDD